MKTANNNKAPKPRWFIVIFERTSQARPQNCIYRRHISVWPKTFATARECDDFRERCFTFKGLPDGKKSASSMSQRTFRRLFPENDRRR